MKLSEFHVDYIRAMCEVESSTYSCNNYVSSIVSEKPNFNGNREKVCEWMFKLVDTFGFDREMVLLGMSYFDRFYFNIITFEEFEELRSSLVKTDFMQLASLTSLFLAVKIHSKFKLNVREFSKCSRGKFSNEDIMGMEMLMLRVLSWRMHPPTISEFVKRFLLFIRPPQDKQQGEFAAIISEILDLASFLSELSVWDEFLLNFKPSTIALAAILEGVTMFDDDSDLLQATCATFKRELWENFGIHPQDKGVVLCQSKLREAYLLSAEHEARMASGDLQDSPDTSNPRQSPTTVIS